MFNVFQASVEHVLSRLIFQVRTYALLSASIMLQTENDCA